MKKSCSNQKILIPPPTKHRYWNHLFKVGGIRLALFYIQYFTALVIIFVYNMNTESNGHVIHQILSTFDDLAFPHGVVSMGHL